MKYRHNYASMRWRPLFPQTKLSSLTLFLGILSSICLVNLATPTPSILPATVPVEHNMTDGELDDPIEFQEYQYMDKKFYRIWKIIAYMPTDEVTMPGFKLIFRVPDEYDALYGISGWPDEEFTFGNPGIGNTDSRGLPGTGYVPQDPAPEIVFDNEI